MWSPLFTPEAAFCIPCLVISWLERHRSHRAGMCICMCVYVQLFMSAHVCELCTVFVCMHVHLCVFICSSYLLTYELLEAWRRLLLLMSLHQYMFIRDCVSHCSSSPCLKPWNLNSENGKGETIAARRFMKEIWSWENVMGTFDE